ncbi:hypothetical protein BDN72DRAFT_739393, partial [Pluteus cervinus]
LGVRPEDWKPRREDYQAYIQVRDNLLRSTVGRVARLRGGIVGRIAAEVVPDHRVLRGPQAPQEIIGTSEDYIYVDDGISEDHLDLICGVYFVAKDKNRAQLSWWPKQSTWVKMGYFGDQWLPSSEDFYLTHQNKFERGAYTIQSGKHWRNQ